MKFLIFTLTSWDEAPRARHQVTRGLLELGHEVYFVQKNKVGFPRFTLKKEGDLTLISTWFVPGYKFRFRLPIINELYQKWLYKKIRSRLGDPFVITFDFTAHKLSSYFSKYIYYCNDEVVGNTTVKSALVDKYWLWCEEKVTKHAKLCIVTSTYLLDKLSFWNDAVYEIPLGGPDPAKIEVHAEKNPREKIILGLVGFIREITISSSVINELLENPKFVVRLIGTVEDKFINSIKQTSRVEQLGVLKDQALYNAIADFDVAIIPYNLESLNPGATSNKLYLHLACGVPVVMSKLPYLESTSLPEGSVYLSENNHDFPTLVAKALNEEKVEYPEMRKKLASGNTWKMRIADLIRILQKQGLYKD